MKKLSAFVLTTLAVGFLALNYHASSPKSGESVLRLNNIQALQAAAELGTYKCDQSNPNCCSYPGMDSNGVLSYTTGSTLE